MAVSSFPEFTCWPAAPANDRAMSRVSAKATRKMPTAARDSSAKSPPPRPGHSRAGSPDGTVPIVETPWADRSRAADAAIPPITTTSIQGTRGSRRRPPTRSASAPADTAMVAPLASPISVTTSRSWPKARSESTGTPSSLPSWPTISTTATPLM